ncbi:MAG: alanine--tRNA ligase, partial [Candidatus Micrarchaeota archaeon]
HAFNTKKTGLFYWKEEAIKDNYNFALNVLGVKEKDLVFQEEVWAGGGSFGPCIEYCAKGLELGNIVFMQYKDLGNGKFRELDTKVIDMGAGLERFAWFTNGSPTSYELTFGKAIQDMKKQTGIKVDEKMFLDYAKLSGILSSDLKDYEKQKELIGKKIGAEKNFFSDLEKLHSLYAIADHLKNILYTTNDGMLPSNSGGGYNLRMILRRVFAFNKEFGFNLDYGKIIENHATHLRELDEEIQDGVRTAIEIIGEEEKKYNSSKINAEKKLTAVIEKSKKEKKGIDSSALMTLYESDGIAPETVKEIAEKKGIAIKIPPDFYQMLAREDEIEKTKEREFTIKFPKTLPLYYEDRYMQEFQAKVLGTIENYLVLDKTLFYPEGGGQIGDMGEINGIKVLDTQQQQGIILHEMEKNKFKKGMTVVGKIDWKKRHSIMKHHTAAHVLNAAARKVLGNHIWQGGSKKEEHKAHLDLTHFKRITSEELKQIEFNANKIIQENLEVENFVMDRNKAEQKFGFRLYQGGAVPGKELRILNIKGVDVEACGGTHIKNTGEIGLFKIIKREGIKDGIERITYSVGLSAVKLTQEKENLLKELAELLSCPETKIVDSTKRIFSEWKQLRKLASKGNYESKTIEVKNPKGRNFVLAEGMPDKAFIAFADRLAKENPEGEIVLVKGEEILVIEGSKSKKQAKETLKEILSKTKGKGGGTEKIARGKIEDKKELEKLAS